MKANSTDGAVNVTSNRFRIATVKNIVLLVSDQQRQHESNFHRRRYDVTPDRPKITTIKKFFVVSDQQKAATGA